ncbi:MAG: hypothetical protein QF464_06265, partial [Myxococcota bacterium]|nr:hypothetical protein [Myxococcota bacterium]
MTSPTSYSQYLELRRNLWSRPGGDVWTRICSGLEDWCEPETRQVVVRYAQGRLGAWPDDERRVPDAWVAELLAGKAPDLVALCRSLSLVERGLTSETLIELLDTIDTSALSILNLAENRLDDRAAHALASCERLGSLRVLDLRDNHISADGLQAILSSRRLSRLEVLELKRNPIDLKELKGLRYLLSRQQRIDVRGLALPVDRHPSSPAGAGKRGMTVGSDIGFGRRKTMLAEGPVTSAPPASRSAPPASRLRFPSDMKFCPSCGRGNPLDSGSCDRCGGDLIGGATGSRETPGERGGEDGDEGAARIGGTTSRPRAKTMLDEGPRSRPSPAARPGVGASTVDGDEPLTRRTIRAVAPESAPRTAAFPVHIDLALSDAAMPALAPGQTEGGRSPMAFFAQEERPKVLVTARSDVFRFDENFFAMELDERPNIRSTFTASLREDAALETTRGEVILDVFYCSERIAGLVFFIDLAKAHAENTAEVVNEIVRHFETRMTPEEARSLQEDLSNEMQTGVALAAESLPLPVRQPYDRFAQA